MFNNHLKHQLKDNLKVFLSKMQNLHFAMQNSEHAELTSKNIMTTEGSGGQAKRDKVPVKKRRYKSCRNNTNSIHLSQSINADSSSWPWLPWNEDTGPVSLHVSLLCARVLLLSLYRGVLQNSWDSSSAAQSLLMDTAWGKDPPSLQFGPRCKAAFWKRCTLASHWLFPLRFRVNSC